MFKVAAIYGLTFGLASLAVWQIAAS